MTETAGSCGLNGKYIGVISPRKPEETSPVLNDIKMVYKNVQANKMAKEYERIMEKPPEERTFSEKVFVAQVNMGKVIDFYEKHKPNVIYEA